MSQETAKSLAFVGCRLIALYFAFGAAEAIIDNSGMIFVSSQADMKNIAAVSILTATLIASKVIVAAVLWFAANPLSRKIVGRPVSPSSAAMTSGILQSSLFSVVGIAFVVWSVPELVAAIYKFGNLDEYRAKDIEGFRMKAEIISSVLKCLLGIMLFLGATGLQNVLAKLRMLGQK
jgi:hypothetical protein